MIEKRDEMEAGTPLLVKIAPDLKEQDKADIASVVTSKKVKIVCSVYTYKYTYISTQDNPSKPESLFSMGSINAQILALGVIMWQDVRDGDHHTFSTPITRVAAVRSESATSPLSRYQRYCKSYIPFVVCYSNERFAIVCST